MKKKIINPLSAVLIAIIFSIACEKEIRNIAGTTRPNPDLTPAPAIVKPVNINEQGFDYWFAFDYRAISPSQIHGIFEGGTMGNLLTSFFVADYKNTRTIMARNGGLLNGIYRSSYFVMDSVHYSNEGDFYRLIDAEGGTNTMWMELRFVADSLYFNAYTSRLGLNFPPTRHMTFKAKKQHIELSQAAANAVGFPKNEPAWDFSEGFVQENLYAEPGAKSASFLAYDETATKDVFTLAAESGDPYTIEQHPHLSYLQIKIIRTDKTKGKKLWLNLSKDPLTDEAGYFNSYDAFDTVFYCRCKQR